MCWRVIYNTPNSYSDPPSQIQKRNLKRRSRRKQSHEIKIIFYKGNLNFQKMGEETPAPPKTAKQLEKEAKKAAEKAAKLEKLAGLMSDPRLPEQPS